MDLTTTEKYALAVLAVVGKPAALQEQRQALYLAASCIWDMMQAKAVAPDEKGRLRVSTPLPETLSYCGTVYARLAKKPMTPVKAALDHISSLTNQRAKALAESMTNNLIGKSLLVTERQSGPSEAKRCHVDTAAIAEDMAAMRDMEVTPEQRMLAALLLESGTAKKMLSKPERNLLKGAVKPVNSDFQTYVKSVTKRFRVVKAIIWASFGAAVGAIGASGALLI